MSEMKLSAVILLGDNHGRYGNSVDVLAFARRCRAIV
jgi:hypothetical protein